MAVTPAQAGPQWPGWDDVIKVRKQMCEDRAGEDAFLAYISDLIKPRAWPVNAARAIAIRLRSGTDSKKHPDAFPIGDISLVLRGCPGARITKNHTGTQVTENTLSHWLRDAGVTVHVPTHHLDGNYSAPGTARSNPPAITTSKALSLVRTAADLLEGLDPTEVAECLDDEMRRQLTAYADDVVNRVTMVFQLLKEKS